MNGLDWAAAVITTAGTVVGYYRGLVSQLVSIAGLFIAYAVAFAFYRDAAVRIAAMFPLSASSAYRQYEFLVKGLHLDTYMYNALAFALLLFGVKFALGFVGRILNWIALTPGVKTVNKWSGAVLGLTEAALLLVIAVQVMAVMPNDTAQRWVKDSRSAPYIINALPSVTGELQRLWDRKTP